MKSLLRLGLLICGLSLSQSTLRHEVRAQEAARPQIDPAAQALIAHSRTAYQDLRSFQAQIETKSSGTGIEEATTLSTISTQKPRKFVKRVQQKEGESVTMIENDTFYYWNPRVMTTKYLRATLPGFRYGEAALMQYLVAGELFTPFLANVDPFAPPWNAAPDTLQIAPTTTLEGVAVETVRAERQKTSGREITTYWFGRDDHLLRRARLESIVNGQSYVVEETYRNLEQNPRLPETTFRWSVPPGTIADDYGPTLASPQLAIGQQPFAIESKDSEGRPFSLSQYKGKVLLLVFWTKDCRPCERDLPHIKQFQEQYGAQGLEIVGVSFDTDRQAFDEYVQQHNLKWRQLFDGKGFKTPFNVLYQVRAVPFTLLIGRTGRIEGVGLRSLLLEEAIVRSLRAAP
jgi:peroxiredoxin/outer membrane lipoprotein-sorting protein